MPALSPFLLKAERTALRRLHEVAGRSRVGRLAQQIGQHGRSLWGSLKARRKARQYAAMNRPIRSEAFGPFPVGLREERSLARACRNATIGSNGRGHRSSRTLAGKSSTASRSGSRSGMGMTGKRLPDRPGVDLRRRASRCPAHDGIIITPGYGLSRDRHSRGHARSKSISTKPTGRSIIPRAFAGTRCGRFRPCCSGRGARSRLPGPSRERLRSRSSAREVQPRQWGAEE